jgi:WD40 repeat protein
MTASPDGQFIATGGADGLIGLWRVYEQQVRYTV